MVRLHVSFREAYGLASGLYALTALGYGVNPFGPLDDGPSNDADADRGYPNAISECLDWIYAHGDETQWPLPVSIPGSHRDLAALIDSLQPGLENWLEAMHEHTPSQMEQRQADIMWLLRHTCYAGAARETYLVLPVPIPRAVRTAPGVFIVSRALIADPALFHPWSKRRRRLPITPFRDALPLRNHLAA